jgi:hypothetical protein
MGMFVHISSSSCQDIAEFNDLDIQFVMRVAKENGFPVK